MESFPANNLEQLEAKLFAYRNIDSNNCWRWGRAKRHGYGVIVYKRRIWATHRASAFLFLGLAEDNATHFVCHKCPNTDCFNPEHIYVGTPRSNTLDSVIDKTHWFSVKTECKLGHAYTEDNIICEKGRHGKLIRRCKTCHKHKTSKYY